MRMKRVNSMIKKTLAEIIAQDFERAHNSLATITEARVSKDLKYATIYVSIIPKEHEKDVLAKLIEQKSDFAKTLGRKISMKRTPEIDFRIDVREAQAARIEELIDTRDND